VTVSLSGVRFGADTADEVTTAQLDDTAMKYLSWILYPLCVGEHFLLTYLNIFLVFFLFVAKGKVNEIY
jgi:hypothetical protein